MPEVDIHWRHLIGSLSHETQDESGETCNGLLYHASDVDSLHAREYPNGPVGDLVLTDLVPLKMFIWRGRRTLLVRASYRRRSRRLAG